MSGLSLRTIQRLEAGHRVSYASLRALAATLEMDVDLLERELYAMNKSSDDFVEIPRWARLLNDGLTFGAPRPSRRDAHLTEAILIGCAVILFAVSFLVSSDVVAKLLRFGGFFELVCGYLTSVLIRTQDTYKLWPGSRGVPSESQPPHRTWRRRAAEYAYFYGIGILGIVIACWIAV